MSHPAKTGTVVMVLACASQKLHQIMYPSKIIIETRHTDCGEIFFSIRPRDKYQSGRLTICLTELDILRDKKNGVLPDKIAERIVEKMLEKSEKTIKEKGE